VFGLITFILSNITQTKVKQKTVDNFLLTSVFFSISTYFSIDKKLKKCNIPNAGQDRELLSQLLLVKEMSA